MVKHQSKVVNNIGSNYLQYSIVYLKVSQKSAQDAKQCHVVSFTHLTDHTQWSVTTLSHALIVYWCQQHWCLSVCLSHSFCRLVTLAEGQTVDRWTIESCVSFVCWYTYILNDIERYLLDDAAKTEVISMLKNERPTWYHLLYYFTSYVLNMFRTLIYPSSGAWDCVVELPHQSSCSQFVVCWSFGAAGFGWCLFCRLKRSPPNTSRTKSPTHNELRTRRLMSTQSQAADDGYINVRNMLST